jgi:hypothetical protein
MDRPTVACPKCGALERLPSAAVRLSGWLRCSCCETYFRYPWQRFYKRDGSLKHRQRSK